MISNVLMYVYERNDSNDQMNRAAANRLYLYACRGELASSLCALVPPMHTLITYLSRHIKRNALCVGVIISFVENATEGRSIKGSEESSFEGEGCPYWGQEEEEATTRVLCHLHLQSSEAGAPRHRHQFQGDEHHEQLCQRHFRAHRCRGISSGSLQPSFDDHQPRDPDGRETASARRTGEARRQRRYQGCHQVHVVQVNWDSIQTSNRRRQKRLFSEPPNHYESKNVKCWTSF
jgi:hypothetical protein